MIDPDNKREGSDNIDQERSYQKVYRVVGKRLISAERLPFR